MILAIAFYTLFGLFLSQTRLKNKVLVFLIVFMSSGFVYLSSILLLFYIFYLTFKNFDILPFNFMVYTITVLLIIYTSLLSIDIGLNVLEILQLLIFVSLFFLINSKLIDSEILESIPIGFILGSVIISLNLIYRNYILNDLSQDNFTFFSISSTYNYTAYYLVFGLIFSSFLIFKNFIKKLLFFFLFCFAIFSLESRSGFLLGSLIFIFLSIKTKSFMKLSFVIISISILIYFLLSSSLFDQNNQNDMVYSVLNYETNSSNLERIEMFTGSIKNLKKNPFGFGLGNTSYPLKKLGIKHPHSHNTLANWLYDFGYVGLFLYLLLIFYFIKIFINRNRYKKISKLNYALILYLILMTQLSALQYNILVTLTTYFIILTIVYYNNLKTYD